MEKEIVKVENGHEVKIALIQKDMEYVRGSLTDISRTLTVLDQKYVRRDELTTALQAIENTHRELRSSITKSEEEIKSKVNTSDFTPIKNILSRLTWLAISTVFIALISLLIHK